MRIVSLGRMAVFNIPLKKWNNEKYVQHTEEGPKTIAKLVDEFLVANYNGYTIRGSSTGRWRSKKEQPVVEEDVIEVKASFVGKERIPKLHKFLAGMCRLMSEECMYLETGEDAFLIYP